jgi:hypothetical protein
VANFQDVLDAVAKVVGGTQPDAVNRPRWFSGDTVGDNTGLQPNAGLALPVYPSFKGCYSAASDSIIDIPIGVVLPGPFTVEGPRSRDVYVRGVEHNIDDLRLIILINRQDAETTFTNLMPYRDLVPAAFAAAMTGASTANVLQMMVRGGKPISTSWGGSPFDGIEFTIRVIRSISRTYSG